jgi:hypothetical protein
VFSRPSDGLHEDPEGFNKDAVRHAELQQRFALGIVVRMQTNLGRIGDDFQMRDGKVWRNTHLVYRRDYAWV